MVFRPKIDNAKVEKIITKGAPVKEDLAQDDDGFTAIKLRIPKGMYAELGEMAKDKVGISKTGLILQAINYQLKEWRESR
jgi:hypothetical protein